MISLLIRRGVSLVAVLALVVVRRGAVAVIATAVSAATRTAAATASIIWCRWCAEQRRLSSRSRWSARSRLRGTLIHVTAICRIKRSRCDKSMMGSTLWRWWWCLLHHLGSRWRTPWPSGGCRRRRCIREDIRWDQRVLGGESINMGTTRSTEIRASRWTTVG